MTKDFSTQVPREQEFKMLCKRTHEYDLFTESSGKKTEEGYWRQLIRSGNRLIHGIIKKRY
jgi:hypothetical protein